MKNLLTDPFVWEYIPNAGGKWSKMAKRHLLVT